jgi:hypothetical protein
LECVRFRAALLRSGGSAERRRLFSPRSPALSQAPLRQSTGAGSPPWPEVPAAQYQTNAGRIFILTAPQPAQNRFYQLRKP